MKKEPTTGSGELAPEVGLEPTTLRLTAACSTIELLRIPEAAEVNGEAGPSQFF